MTGGRDPADRWDWSSTMFVLLVVIVTLALTFEIWATFRGESLKVEATCEARSDRATDSAA